MDQNTKVIKKCDDNIEKLEKDNKEKDDEIMRKTKQLKVLKAKSERILQQKIAVQKYNDFLEEVKNQHNDEYSEVGDILSRFYILNESKRDLFNKLEKMEG